MRLKTRRGDLSASACDRHLAKHMRDVCPINGGNTDTHVLVRRLDRPDPLHWCSCKAPATWFLRTLEVIR